MTQIIRTAIALASCLTATITQAHASDSPKAVVEQRFAAVRRHDVDAIVALYADTAVETSPGFCHDRMGPAGARQTYSELFTSFPSITDDVTAIVVDGKHVAVQFIARVKKPDGTLAFEAPLANFITVEHGRITRDDTYFDAKGRPCN
jgi:ketosteroid isomerase-like protein